MLFLLECNVEQMLHKNLWTDLLLFFFPSHSVFYFSFLFLSSRGGSVCLSWLLEPSLSILREKQTDNFRLFVCRFFLIRSSDSPLLQHQKKRVLLYISSGLLSLSVCTFLFFPTGEVLLYLTGWFDFFFFFFSDCFLEIKFYGIILRSLCFLAESLNWWCVFSLEHLLNFESLHLRYL